MTDSLQNKILMDIQTELRTQRAKLSMDVTSLHEKIDDVRKEQNAHAVQLIRIEGGVNGNKKNIVAVEGKVSTNAINIGTMASANQSIRTKVAIGVVAFCSGIAMFVVILRMLPVILKFFGG